MTAHVDFSSLAESGKEEGLEVSGFCEQFHFLMGLGIFDEFHSNEEEGAFNPVEPLLGPLHADPRWQPMLESMGKSAEQLDAIEFSVTLPQ